MAGPDDILLGGPLAPTMGQEDFLPPDLLSAAEAGGYEVLPEPAPLDVLPASVDDGPGLPAAPLDVLPSSGLDTLFTPPTTGLLPAPGTPPPIIEDEFIPPPPPLPTEPGVEAFPAEVVRPTDELMEPVPEPPLLEAPPLSQAQRAGAQVVTTAKQLDTYDAQIARLQARRQELQELARAEQDPVARAELVDRLQTVGVAEEALRNDRVRARQSLNEESAVLQQEVQLSAQQAQRAAITEQRRKTQALARQTAQRVADSQQESERLRTKLADDRKEYQNLLRNPPTGSKLSIGLVIADVLAETLRASSKGQFPNYSNVLARAQQLQQAEVQNAAKAQLLEIEGTTSDLEYQARLRDEIKAQNAASAAAIAQEVELSLQTQLERAQEPAQQASLALGLQAVRAEREQKEAAAIQARQEADRKLRKQAAEQALLEARIIKERAGARKTEAEAVRAERRARGGSGRPAATPGLLPENAVAFPGTDRVAFRIGGDKPTKEDIKRATKIRTSVNYYGQMLRQANELEAAVEDAEEAGVFGTRFDRSGQWADLQSRLNDLTPDMAKIGSGGFAATEADMDWARDNLPSVPTSWNTREKSLRKVRALKSRLRARARFAYSTFGMRPEMAEQFVAQMEGYSTSKSDIGRAKLAKAERIAADEKAPAGERVQALDGIEEKARAEGEAQDADWVPQAANKYLKLVDTVTDPEVTAALEQKVSKLRRYVSERSVVLSLPPVMQGQGIPENAKAREEFLKHGNEQGWLSDEKLADIRNFYQLRQNLEDAEGRLRVKRGFQQLTAAGEVTNGE